MFSRKKPPLTREEQLQAQRKLALPLTPEEREKAREKKYGSASKVSKQIGKCVGEGCVALGERANDAMVALNPLLEEGSEKLTECMEYTGDTYNACAARVKKTAQNAAEAAGDVARNTAVGAHAAMIRTLPPSVQTNINVSKRLDAEKKKFDNEIRKRDKQYPEFQLFVTTADGKTQALLVHGYHNIYDIKIMLQDRGVYIFNLFKVNGNTYTVDNNSDKTLSDLDINQDNQTIIISGGTKKTKKRRKSTTTKRRKMVRRRKGTKKRRV